MDDCGLLGTTKFRLHHRSLRNIELEDGCLINEDSSVSIVNSVNM